MGADAAPEEHFGPYVVYERLGVGGMATVHRALERNEAGLERIVALKRLLPHLAEDASFIKSFVREAKLASLLSHLNIVQIYELGRVGTQYFITMEYIDGRDVRQILRHARKVSGPPPLNISIGLVIQLAEALDYAHNKVDEDGHPLGLVHRDVSPSNLLVTSQGHVKVIDFGIAKAQSSQLRTQTGRVKGKLAYMAPEAISGSKDLDARSDLWAAGVILHELLTARPLFASKNEYQTLLKVQRGDILPPSTFNQACPPEVDAIVLKALARDPDERFSRAAELREELIEVKRQYALATSYRDLAGWVDWAFSLETPGAFSGPNTTGVSSVQSMIRHKTPRPPRNREEDEAVELVWGTGEVHSESGPLLLEEVPDVSGKVPAPEVSFDDIPTPMPSHGAGFAVADLAAATDPALPPYRADPHDTHPPPARGSNRLVAQRGTGPHTPLPEKRPSDPQVPRPRSITSPGIAVPRTLTPGRATARDERAATELDPRTFDSGPQQAPATDPSGSPIDVDDLPAFPDDSAPTMTQLDKQRPEPALPSVPVVRFSKQQTVPPALATVTPTATKPGMPPLSRPPARAPESGAITLPGAAARAKRPSDVTIGQSMIERRRSGRGWLIAAAALVLVGGGAFAMVLAMRGKPDDRAKPAQEPVAAGQRTTGALKFVTEPGDAEIRIEGQPPHAGSPWTTELAAGTYQVEIHRTGYKAWLTTVELSAAENQTLRVVLEPLGAASEPDTASLAISTTPDGLDVTIDGKPAGKTPLKQSIKAGAHVIAVHQNGVEVWHQTLRAEANSDYEFNPSFTADKQRERAARAQNTPVAAAAHAATIADKPAAPVDAAVEVNVPEPTPEPATVETPAPPPLAVPTPPPAPAPLPVPAPPPPKLATPAPPPAPAKPVLVLANQVKRVSGDMPNLEKSKYDELPSLIAVKVCIDAGGNVAAAEVLTRVDRRTASELVDAIRTWKYTPYRSGGAAVPACFSVPFRISG
ncbi:MAG: protein kinase domain-containing protein [Acidobacteriota bacterium]